MDSERILGKTGDFSPMSEYREPNINQGELLTQVLGAFVKEESQEGIEERPASHLLTWERVTILEHPPRCCGWR